MIDVFANVGFCFQVFLHVSSPTEFGYCARNHLQKLVLLEAETSSENRYWYDWIQNLLKTFWCQDLPHNMSFGIKLHHFFYQLGLDGKKIVIK